MKTFVSHGTGALQLREYQTEAVDAIQHYQKQSPILVAATGAGKTVMASKVIVDRLKMGPVLFLAHRDELLDQTVEKFETVFDSFGAFGQSIRVGRVQADENEMDADVVVASVQTLANRKRLAEWVDSHGETSTIITDECHHARANTYLRIYEALGYLNTVQDTGGEEVERLHLGLTATPYRTDQKALNGVFDGVAYAIGLWELMEQGYLVPPKEIKLPLIEALNETRSDWTDEELDEQVNNSRINQEIAEAWETNAKERLTIAFCTSVTHAHALAETFQGRGIQAAVIHGAMPKDERHAMLDAFSKGELRVLCNYGVLTEGFDRPEVSCLIMARPTTSHGLFTQILGRGLRIAPHIGKRDCLVLDVVGVTNAHRLVTIDRLIQEREEAREQATMSKKPNSGGLGLSNRMHSVDPARFNWLMLRDGVWMLRDFDGGMVRVTREGDTWRVVVGRYLSAYQNRRRQAESQPIIEPMAQTVYVGPDSQMAWGFGSTYAHLNLKKSAVRVDEDWMIEPPSDKQREALLKRGVEVPNTKFEAMMELSKPSKKQADVIRNFLKRNHLSMNLLPALGDEAGDMMNVCSSIGWLNVPEILSEWQKVVPHLFLNVESDQKQAEAV